MEISQVLVNPIFLAVLSIFLWRAIMIENPVVKLVFQAIGTVITLLLGFLFAGVYNLLLKQCNDPTYEWCSIWAAYKRGRLHYYGDCVSICDVYFVEDVEQKAWIRHLL